MTDPVDQDLRRYLAQEEASEALSEAVDELIEQWLKSQEKVKKYLDPIFEYINDTEDFFNVAARSILSGNEEPMRGWLLDALREGMRPDATTHVQAEIDQSWADKSEADALRREDHG